MKSLYALLPSLCGLGSIDQTSSIKQSPVLSDGDATSVGISEERLKHIETMLVGAVDSNETNSGSCKGYNLLEISSNGFCRH
jgi:hypothetical protein